MEQGHERTVFTGTHRTAAGTIWEPVKNCLLQPDGLWTPSREQALSDYAAEEATRRQVAQEAEAVERLAAEQRLRGRQRSEAQVQELQALLDQVRSDPANEARRRRVQEEQREKERRRAFRLAFNGER